MNIKLLFGSSFLLMFVCQVVFSQKLLRTRYQTMFEEFPLLEDSLMTDKYRGTYYRVNDWAWWEHRSNGSMNLVAVDSERGTKFVQTDTLESSSCYWFFIYNTFAIDCDSITFCGEVLVGEGHTVTFLLRQERNDEMVDVEASSKWQRVHITQPFNKSIDKKPPMFLIDVHGHQSGTTYVRNLNVLLDNRPIDEVYPMLSANRDHEFDSSSFFHFHHESLTDEEVERLALLCKVWGLYKYRHPIVRSGQYDWNFQLFRMLSHALYAKDNKDFINGLMNLLPDNNTLDVDFSGCTEDSVLAHVHFNWINQYKDNKKFYCKLNFLSSYVDSAPCYCLGYMQSDARLTYFYNESFYENISPSDDGYRMLALFRFWNMMYYFHPYMYQMENKWERVLPDYIRLFAAADGRTEFEEACVRLTCELKDAHSEFYGCKEDWAVNVMLESSWLPLITTLQDDKVIVKGFYSYPVDSCELQVGDAIMAVNHKTIANIRKEKSIYNNFGNGTTDRYALHYTSFNGDSVVYTIERDGRCMDIMIADVYERYWKKMKGVDLPEHDAFCMLSDSICYLDLSLLTSEQLRKNMEQAKQCKGIVFDMRGYPKTSECADIIASYLYPHRKALFYFSYADCYQPGVFRKNPHFQEYGMENPDYYKGTPVVLVNGLTMSEAEFVATMIGNAPKGYVIGEPTSGVYGNVLYIPFISGIATRITGRGAYWFDGTCTFPEGVQIDRYVYPAIGSIKEGKDRMLEEAIKYIMNNQDIE